MRQLRKKNGEKTRTVDAFEFYIQGAKQGCFRADPSPCLKCPFDECYYVLHDLKDERVKLCQPI
jgi:hypothetical protein